MTISLFFLTAALGNLWWIMTIAWAIILLVTVFIELETADITTVWFSLAALVSLIISLFKVHEAFQVCAFVLVSIGLLFATRPFVKKIMRKEIIPTNADAIIGKIGTITVEIIDDGIGEVRVNNSLWRAISLDETSIPVGEKVFINSITGIKVVVSKIKNQNNLENI